MFRFLRPTKSILSTARLPMRLENMRGSGQLENVQRVRFQAPGFRWRPFIMSCILLYTAAEVYDKFVLEPLAGAAEAADAIDLPNTDNEEEEEETSIFIPFPGTTKQLKPEPYRGSDPEWKAFIAFSKDQALAKRVREELANRVKKVAEKHPLLFVKCGKNMKLRRYWLDVDFPTHAPPDFERTGLEIADDFIAISTLPVDSMTASRISNVLWPTPLMRSFWSFTKVLVAEDLKRAAQFFGLQAGGPSITMEQVLANHVELQRPPTKDASKDRPPPLPPLTQTPNRVALPTQPETKAVEGERIRLFSYPDHTKAMLAFKTELLNSWRPARAYPPRGSLLVSGFVEIDAPKAWLVFDVKAAWDPSTNKYDDASMTLKLRRLQMKKQGAIGGA